MFLKEGIEPAVARVIARRAVPLLDNHIALGGAQKRHAIKRRVRLLSETREQQDIMPEPALNGGRGEKVAIEIAEHPIAAGFLDEVEAKLEMIARFLRRQVCGGRFTERKRTGRAVHIETHTHKRDAAGNSRRHELLQQSSKRDLLMLLGVEHERIQKRKCGRQRARFRK